MSDHEIPEEIARRLRPLGDEPAPEPNPALAAFFVAPGAPLTEKGDLSATAGSNVYGPVTANAGQAAGLPKRRRRMIPVLGDVLGAVSRLALVGKVALGAGAIAVAGMGSAAAVNAVVSNDPPAPPVVQTVVPDTHQAGDTSTDPTSGVSDSQPSDATSADDQGDNSQGSKTDDSTDGSGDQATSSDDQGGDSQGSTSEDSQGSKTDDSTDGSGDQATSSDDQGTSDSSSTTSDSQSGSGSDSGSGDSQSSDGGSDSGSDG